MSSRRARRKGKRRNDRLRQEAWAAYVGGHLARARELYADVVARAPGNARYLYELGLVERAAGRPVSARRALLRAVALAQGEHVEALAALAEMGAAGDAPGDVEIGSPVEPLAAEPLPTAGVPAWAEAVDWLAIAGRLTRDGVVRVPRVLDPEGSPPALVAGVRSELERIAEEIARRWSAVMGTTRAPDLQGVETALAGEARTGSPAGAVPAPEVVLCLGRTLEVATADVRPGRERRHSLSLDAGDAALVCSARRPVRVGGTWGWQPVASVGA